MTSQFLLIISLFSIIIITQQTGCFVKSKDELNLKKLKECENFVKSPEFEIFKEKTSSKLKYFVKDTEIQNFEDISEKLNDYKSGRSGPKYTNGLKRGKKESEDNFASRQENNNKQRTFHNFIKFLNTSLSGTMFGTKIGKYLNMLVDARRICASVKAANNGESCQNGTIEGEICKSIDNAMEPFLESVGFKPEGTVSVDETTQHVNEFLRRVGEKLPMKRVPIPANKKQRRVHPFMPRIDEEIAA